jgi:hypothetical protein
MNPVSWSICPAIFHVINEVMKKQLYRAVVFYAPNNQGKYREISRVQAFIEYMAREYYAHTIYFYDNDTHDYVGYWKRGMATQIHTNTGRKRRPKK